MLGPYFAWVLRPSYGLKVDLSGGVECEWVVWQCGRTEMAVRLAVLGGGARLLGKERWGLGWAEARGRRRGGR